MEIEEKRKELKEQFLPGEKDARTQENDKFSFLQWFKKKKSQVEVQEFAWVQKMYILGKHRLWNSQIFGLITKL